MKRTKPATTVAADAMERFQELAHRLERDEWERRVGRLAAEMVVQHQEETVESSLHQEIEELLPLYVPEELAGIDVLQRYPLVAGHLTHCLDCRTSYTMLKAALNVTSAPAPRTAAMSEEAAWRREEIPAKPRQPQGVKFIIEPHFLRTRYTEATLFRSSGREKEVLLVGDSFLLDNKPLVVETWLAPSAAEKERFELRVVIKGSQALARRIRFRLDWGKHHQESQFKQGQAYFDPVNLTDLQSPVSLTLELVPYDRPRRH